MHLAEAFVQSDSYSFYILFNIILFNIIITQFINLC